MKAIHALALLCALFTTTASAETPKFAITAGLNYSAVTYTDKAGTFLNALFGPSPDKTGNYSVGSVSGGILYVSKLGLGGKADFSLGVLSQSGMHFDSDYPRYSDLLAANGLFEIADHFQLTAGLHANELRRSSLGSAYLGLGWQFGAGFLFDRYLVAIERMSDSEGDFLGFGHTELKTTRLTATYLFSLR